MNVARQLYQLQEIDQQTDSTERSLQQLTGQLGESEELLTARTETEKAEQHLKELASRQHSREWEAEDLTTKLDAEEKKLYSGRVTNPKELLSLQHDVETLRARISSAESDIIVIMDETDRAKTDLDALRSRLESIETEWRHQQQQVSAEIKELESTLSSLRLKREQTTAQLDPQLIDFYESLRKKKSFAVARIEQGICTGCRISLSSVEIQRARSGRVTQCSSCARILFLG